MDDLSLLREYTETGSSRAFALLVEHRAAELKAVIAATAEEFAETRLVVAALVNPIDRARAVVGPLVARLKRDHIANPPPARRPPPPSGPNGIVFPELLGDLEYNRLHAMIVHSELEQQHLALLKKLEIDSAVGAKVIGLLTERRI